METLIGITFDKWLQLLTENNFRIHPGRLHLSAYLTLLSLRNSRIAKKERQQYGDAIERTTIEKPPIFILGHWRSGTTLLHNIISLDSQLIYNPLSFLIVEEKLAKRRNLNQERKRPMDNVTVTPLSPGEEEFALSTLSLKSPLLAWNFPAKKIDLPVRRQTITVKIAPKYGTNKVVTGTVPGCKVCPYSSKSSARVPIDSEII